MCHSHGVLLAQSAHLLCRPQKRTQIPSSCICRRVPQEQCPNPAGEQEKAGRAQGPGPAARTGQSHSAAGRPPYLRTGQREPQQSPCAHAPALGSQLWWDSTGAAGWGSWKERGLDIYQQLTRGRNSHRLPHSPRSSRRRRAHPGSHTPRDTPVCAHQTLLH